MPLVESTFRAPWWIPGGHLQTIYTYLLAPRPRLALRRERWELADGDFLDLDWSDGAGDSPVVVLFHGLEGNARGHYSMSLMAHVRALGWRGVVPHFRGCSGQPNRLPRAYHSGDSAEIDAILRRISHAANGIPVYAVGVSLGGNALLKWLGEQKSAARNVVSAAAAISAPLDLHAAGGVLDRGFNKYTYTWHFLRTLKKKALHKSECHGLPISPDAIQSARTLRRFDDLYTAPVHGFKDADDYWSKASSKPLLKHIAVPTLVINALNDPFLPADALPAAEEVSAHVSLEYPDTGGHVGFVSGPFPGSLDWLPRRILQFLSLTRSTESAAA